MKRTSKKYLLTLSIALAAATAIPPLAIPCLCPDESGYHSSPFQVGEGLENTDQPGNTSGFDETLDFWCNYTKGNVSREAIKGYFNSDEENRKKEDLEFIEYLEANNDRHALNYIAACEQLAKLVKAYNDEIWDYEPAEPEDIEAFIKQIEKVTTSNEFKPRYEFLKIRAYGAIQDDEGVMKVWQKNAKKPMPEALRNRMGGYVGGVLYRQGKYPEAIDYFAKTGDNNSLQWCVEKLAGIDNLTRLYEHDPNSTALPYILQDYFNYLISSTWAGRGNQARSEEEEDYSVFDSGIREMRGMEVYDTKSQTNELIALCRRVLEEGKSESPQLWGTALGVAQGINGDTSASLASLKEAAGMKGIKKTAENLENFTIWAQLLNTGRNNEEADREFADTFRKYYNATVSQAKKIATDYSQKARKQRRDGENRSFSKYEFMTNFLAKEGVAHFNKTGNSLRAMAFLAMLDDMPVIDEWPSEFLAELRDIIDRTGTLDEGKAFEEYAAGNLPVQNPIDKLMQPYAAKYLNLANDAIGTRLMRLGRFEEALSYLSQVDPRWSRTQNIAPYLGICYPDPEYYDWSGGNQGDTYVLRSNLNYKATYCSEIIDALEEVKNLVGDEKAQKALELAALFHYGSPMGKGWALTDYSWSVTRPTNEMTEMTHKWLGIALQNAQNVKTKNMVYYGILSMPSGLDKYGDPLMPFGIERNYTSNTVRYYIDSPTSRQREGLRFLSSHWQDDLPYNISRCDILQSYMAGRFISKPTSW